MSDTKVGVRISAAMISHADIVPEEYQNQLMYWSHVFTDGAFAIGDIANELFIGCLGKGMHVSSERVYEAIAHYCGKTSRTIRYYSENAAFYSVEVREEFDMLSFSYFVFARSMGRRWREVLEYSAENISMSLEAVKRHYLSEVMSSPDDQSVDAVLLNVPEEYDAKSLIWDSSPLSVSYDLGMAGHLSMVAESMRGLVAALDALNVDKPYLLDLRAHVLHVMELLDEHGGDIAELLQSEKVVV